MALNPRTNMHEENIGRAAFILGCLALEGHVIIDIEDRESIDGFGRAVRVIVEALDATVTEYPEDMSCLPYMQPHHDFSDWFKS